MSSTHQERHPFLDDLTAEAELISSVLRGPVIGREEIRRVVDAVGTFYVEQAPTFMEIVGSRTFLEYEALLTSGERLNAIVIIDRHPDGSIPRVSVRMAPVHAVVSLADHLKGALSGQLPKQLFL
ncbi:hypothetical protein [Rhizobium leguminosarum]|uniref:Uncharacterized protein n=2 Tax=Rhizobium TaxID=379 RepID=A0ACD5EI07_9HYPH|nr:hypothetical protein [Rhizobium leguminosarum]MBY5435833.1 hypothetical protein [Rhizobium leguminosarum]NEI34241.1 hypothetical protein [Rhizobium leguminosarum]NEI40604.1 hypothetical protein [Rhizobium leguminosarum]